MHINLRSLDDAFATFNYYSPTFDCFAVVGEEEDCRLVKIATFERACDAETFEKDHPDVLFVRPPHDQVRSTMRYLNSIALAWGEGLPFGKR